VQMMPAPAQSRVVNDFKSLVMGCLLRVGWLERPVAGFLPGRAWGLLPEAGGKSREQDPVGKTPVPAKPRLRLAVLPRTQGQGQEQRQEQGQKKAPALQNAETEPEIPCNARECAPASHAAGTLRKMPPGALRSVQPEAGKI
ncbi:MAG: hypothetical protein J5600_02215, partial [Desulfovibrio sp.]|nr:hypothetical protein [Desulfovibrio sp.]